jgi:pimeloyl-ACP methyl ester carboxylesterase/predicted small lipoprotein YifL
MLSRLVHAVGPYLLVSLLLNACGREGPQGENVFPPPARGAGAEQSADSTVPPLTSDDPIHNDRPVAEMPVQEGLSQFSFRELEVGLYWIGPNNQMQKLKAQERSRFYDPKKPTLIYVHGWQPGSVAAARPESMVRTISGDQRDLAKGWIDQRWNVAVFYWTQIADDDLFVTEQKIWDAGAVNWLDQQGQRNSLPGKSAAELFFDAYSLAMKQHQSGEIRIVGHSLGAQMASALSKRVVDAVGAQLLPRVALPERLILLDPFFTSQPKNYLEGQWTGERVRAYAQDITAAGLSLEVYRSSVLSYAPLVADRNQGLNRLAAFSEIASQEFIDRLDQATKHSYAVFHYLASIAYPPLPVMIGDFTPDTPVPQVGLSASTRKADVLRYMAVPLGLRILSGKDTPTPQDDVVTFDRFDLDK